MHSWLTIPLVLGAVLAPPPGLHAQTALQKALKDTDVGDHWIYDDLGAGFARARATGKPLLVLFRCVP
jgi:hypothetical protein